QDVDDFAASVLDRFSNPCLDHRWENIALNFSSKMNMRAVPLLDKWYSKNVAPPIYFALGFAAYLTIMNSKKSEDHYLYTLNGREMVLQDEFAPLLYAYWQDPTTAVHNILKDTTLWSVDLTKYPGLEESICEYAEAYRTAGVLETIQKTNTSWLVTY